MKPISVTSAEKQALIDNFTQFLKTFKSDNGRVNYNVILPTLAKERPKVCFTTTAFAKMKLLVADTDSEIGWHGTVYREDSNFLISDIILYPQVISAATVTTDDTEYSNWLAAQPDEIFNLIRFQGHSHVRMGVVPSSVDTNYYNNILGTLRADDYYIFAILNKAGDMTIMIYDYSQNTLFETADIDIEVVDDSGVLVRDWVAANTKAYTKKYTYQAPVTTLANYGSGYSTKGSEYTYHGAYNIDDDDIPGNKSGYYMDNLPSTVPEHSTKAQAKTARKALDQAIEHTSNSRRSLK